MKQTLTHTSASGNMYLYDHKSNMSMLIHPELKKAIENDINCDAYYKDKYKYLIDNGFFSDSSSINFATIDENTIKNCIVQVPHIVFETTDFCNLNCLYCSFGDFYEGFDTRHHRKINFDHAVRLLKYIFKYGILLAYKI